MIVHMAMLNVVVFRWHPAVEVSWLRCHRQNAAFRHVETVHPVQGSDLVC